MENLLIFLSILFYYGSSGAGADDLLVSVNEGDSVTLNTGVKTNQQEKITWYFNDIRIAQISGDLRVICTDVQCNEVTERFRDGLELDHQTGSLTIMNITNTDSGEYRLAIISHSSGSEKIFRVAVHGFSSVDPDRGSVSVMEGDSVTLLTGIKTNQPEMIKWYFNDTRIAQISGDLSFICTGVQCNKGTERFRNRLKLDHQTGSLTIRNTRTTDSGEYQLQINSRRGSISTNITRILIVAVSGFSSVDPDRGSVSVMKGDSVTLLTGIKTNQPEMIKWYFNDTRIAQISGDLSFICTDVQCNEGTERFRNRLKLDHQTGSLIITNTRTTDSGEYQLQINSRRGSFSTISTKIFIVAVSGFLGFGADGLSVFVMEEDSVTLHSDVKTDQKQFIKWFMNGTRIAIITRDQSEICTDAECPESFRDRLKLDHQAESLTIMNITNTDSGLYQLQISGNTSKIILGVVVHNFSASERDEIKRKSVKEGESATLDTHVKNKPDNVMWYFNETLITEITRDQSNICSDVQCKERFRDRLHLDPQTGSLTITDTRTTDSGDYTLQIRSSRFTIMRSFSVSVRADRTGIYAGVSAVLVFLVASAGLIYFCKCHLRRKYNRAQRSHQANGVEDSNQTECVGTNTPHESSLNQTESEVASETLT